MKYQVTYTKTALKQLKKMDKKIAAFILAYIEENLVDCENPRLIGKPLKGELADKWRYRVGNYRILASIQDEKVTIVVAR